MSNVAALKQEPAPILACTISRDVQNFDLLIEDMEAELGESWGDLSFSDAALFLSQPDATSLEFIAIAVDDQDETELARIGELIRTAKTRAIKVILIAEEVSPIILHQMLRFGADDFVPYPLPEGALRESIERIRRPEPEPMPTGATEAPAPAFKARGDRDGVVLPVHGMTGGCGSTTFAVNLAWELATSQKKNNPRVCLIDFDLQMGSVATYLDLPRREAIYDILSDSASVDSDAFIQSLQSVKDKLHVFTAPAEMLPLDMINSEDVERIIDMARSNFDFVVIDMPKTVVQWTESVLHQAHVYFTLLELDMRSAQNALRFIRALKAEELPFEKLRFALNRAPKFTDLSAKARAKRMAESLDIKLEIMLPDGARQITQANDHGQPIAETAAKNPLRRELQKLAKSLYELNQSVEQAKG